MTRRLRGIYCYTCKSVKENRYEGYCNACRRKKDNEKRLATGQTKKHQTGLCPCGKERASYSRSYCKECLSFRGKKRKPLTDEQRKRRNELQRKRWQEKYGLRKVIVDEEHIKQREIYHSDIPLLVERRLRHQVRALTRAYIKAGKLIRLPCEVCNEIKVDAHHDDYNKPFDVRWLCRKHHVEHHKSVKMNEQI